MRYTKYITGLFVLAVIVQFIGLPLAWRDPLSLVFIFIGCVLFFVSLSGHNDNAEKEQIDNANETDSKPNESKQDTSTRRVGGIKKPKDLSRPTSTRQKKHNLSTNNWKKKRKKIDSGESHWADVDG